MNEGSRNPVGVIGFKPVKWESHVWVLLTGITDTL